MKVIRIPITGDGADTLYDQINREYRKHHISISIHNDHIQMVIYSGLDECDIEYDEEIAYISVTGGGMVVVSIMGGCWKEAYEIIILIFQLIQKLEEENNYGNQG